MYGKRKKRAKRLNGGDVHFVKITVKITPPPWLALPLIEQKYHFVQLYFRPPDAPPRPAGTFRIIFDINSTIFLLTL